MKTRTSNRTYIAYGISLAATFITLMVLHLAFECPMFLSLFLITGAHALGFAALRVIPRYTLWMPPLTALYLSGWYWMGTCVKPHFMAAADKTPDFGSGKTLTAVWITTLLFCGIAGVIYAIIKLVKAAELPEEFAPKAPPKHTFKVHIAARVTVCCLSAAVVVTSALCAYLYREEKVAELTAELTRPTDYTVILPNLYGETDPDVPDYSEKTVGIVNHRVTYQKIQDESPKDLISATQSYLYGKGDLTVATVVLRHKDSSADPVRDYSVSNVTLSYRSDPHAPDAPFTTVTVPDTLKQEIIDIMMGKTKAPNHAPENMSIIEPVKKHTARITVSFADHPEISWRAQVYFTEAGKWYLAVYTLSEDFDMKGSWYMDFVYYPLDDAWQTS